jgi:hypothetical protein
MMVSAIAASACPERISPMRVRSGVIGMVAVALPFSTSVKVRSNARTQGAKFSSRKVWASCGVIFCPCPNLSVSNAKIVPKSMVNANLMMALQKVFSAMSPKIVPILMIIPTNQTKLKKLINKSVGSLVTQSRS